jgi:hypothetical protein
MNIVFLEEIKPSANLMAPDEISINADESLKEKVDSRETVEIREITSTPIVEIKKRKQRLDKLPPRHILVPEWPEISKHIHLRDKICMEPGCGASEKLSVHHIDENIYNNFDDNLILLCLKHHFQRHHKHKIVVQF